MIPTDKTEQDSSAVNEVAGSNFKSLKVFQFSQMIPRDKWALIFLKHQEQEELRNNFSP